MSPIDYLDQYISLLFFNQYTGYFYGETSTICMLLYHATHYIAFVIIIAPIYCVLNHQLSFKKYLMLIMLVAIIPGLTVNLILKEHVKRPRPYQVIRDGANYVSLTQMHISVQTTKYNSFPSGHAAMGFMCGIPWLFFNKKKFAISVSLICGTILSAVRIMQGGHYLSDVIASGLIVWTMTIVITLLVKYE